VADLAKPEIPRLIADVVHADSLVIDFLINNAGFGLGGKFAETDARILPNSDIKPRRATLAVKIHA
jgi:short-subunit dehydrogenase